MGFSVSIYADRQNDSKSTRGRMINGIKIAKKYSQICRVTSLNMRRANPSENTALFASSAWPDLHNAFEGGNYRGCSWARDADETLPVSDETRRRNNHFVRLGYAQAQHGERSGTAMRHLWESRGGSFTSCHYWLNRLLAGSTPQRIRHFP
jgi:hypothetical protein